jgi:hypothetical protein
LIYFALSVGNQHRHSYDFLSHRLLSQAPVKKQADDEDSHIRTSSVSSTSAPLILPPINQKLTAPNDTSTNVKVNIL